MTFSFSLKPATKQSATVAPPSDSDLDYDSLVMEACQVLAETDSVFTLRGFGDDWPVDIAYDLSTLVEQLADLLDDLYSHREDVRVLLSSRRPSLGHQPVGEVGRGVRGHRNAFE